MIPFAPPYLKIFLYYFIKKDEGLKTHLMKVIENQTVESIEAMAHVKHQIFSTKPIIEIIRSHYNGKQGCNKYHLSQAMMVGEPRITENYSKN